MRRALAIAVAGLAIAADAFAIERTWTGAADNKWSTAANWSPAGVPANGDSLKFQSAATATENDLASSTRLLSVVFEGSGHTLSGNVVHVTAGATGGVSFFAAVRAEGNIVASAEHFVQLDAGGYTVDCHVCPIDELIGTGTVQFGDSATTLSGSHSFSGTITDGNASMMFGHDLTLSNVSMPAATFNIGRRVIGSGTIGPLDADGEIDPKNGTNAIGSLATGHLVLDVNFGATPELAGDYIVDIAAAGNDVLLVTGSVSIDKALNLRFPGGFTPAPGTSYTIIDNDGSDAIEGIFVVRPSPFTWPGTPLHEGTAFEAGGHWFRITYQGGTGNDAVLNAIAPPASTSISLVVSCADTCGAPPPGASWAVVGQPVTLTVTVTSSGGTPDGTVSFYGGYEGDALLGTATLSEGTASLTTTFTPPSVALSARYHDTDSFTGSTSTASWLSVVRAPTQTVATSTQTGPGTYLLEAVVSAAGNGSGTPDGGSISITEGATSFGSPTVVAGQASQTLNLEPGSHTLTLYFGGNDLYEPSITTISIDAGEPQPAVLNIDDSAESREGNAGEQMIVRVEVRLSAAASEPVTVEYRTEDDTARAGSDYESAAGTLTFAPGETSKRISVALIADAIAESHESFVVVLSGATAATIHADQARITILDDDSSRRRRSVRR